MAGKGKGFQIFSNIIMILLSASAVLPFVLLVVSSITSEATITKYGYSFLPRDIDFTAYQYLFMSGGKILRSYGMTIIVAGIGTTLNICMTMAIGYLLSKRDLPGRNLISFFIFFTMLFSGGMIPGYIVWSQVMHVSDTIFGLICPNLMMSAFNVILMRTYFTTNVPVELCEAAEMDSCSQIGILIHISIPLSKPMISTLSLFAMLAYWNDWINGLYYLVRNKDLYTIQNVLNTMQNNVQFLKDYASSGMGDFASSIPSLGVRMAIAVISIVPIMVAYPFFQKSFVRGIVIGGVKG
ncbi:MAG TPA: carbohydrate ABC transporter permease [Candidatus Eisenbergiella intestinipullorum]|nr:carbohydrate ABC transporter permease [Candidatus Eisenbergiella intestinipullorum]